MAKKNSLSIVYLIGMALVAVGFICPIFTGFFGREITGFDIVGNGDTTNKICVLLVFIGGIAGVVFSFIPKANKPLYKVIAIAVSIIGFAIVAYNIQNGSGMKFVKALDAQTELMKSFFKHLTYGAYMIMAGWVIAIAGLVMKK